MRKFFIAVAAICAFAGVAQAELILHVEDVIVNTATGAGSLEVFLEETGPTNAVVSTYNVGLRQVPRQHEPMGVELPNERDGWTHYPARRASSRRRTVCMAGNPPRII